MKEQKIRWCYRQKRGIELIEPNTNLSEQYMKDADKTLEDMQKISGKWMAVMAYYACYEALYAILMKTGIKSEIHDCSLALMGLISDFDSEDIIFMERLKEKRINAQYYLKEISLDNIDSIKDFVLKCKKTREDLDIDEIRDKVAAIIEGDKN